MLRKFQANYSSDIKTLKTPRCIRHRTAKEHNEVWVVSSMVLSMYQSKKEVQLTFSLLSEIHSKRNEKCRFKIKNKIRTISGWDAADN